MTASSWKPSAPTSPRLSLWMRLQNLWLHRQPGLTAHPCGQTTHLLDGDERHRQSSNRRHTPDLGTMGLGPDRCAAGGENLSNDGWPNQKRPDAGRRHQLFATDGAIVCQSTGAGERCGDDPMDP